MDRKSIRIYAVLIIIVLAVILAISFIKGNGEISEKDIQCIADNSLFIVKEGCSACAFQKNSLEGHLDKFNTIDCAYEPEKCSELKIEHVPTWIINDVKYEGVRSLEELKQLTEC